MSSQILNDRFEELCAAYVLGVAEKAEIEELKKELESRDPDKLARLSEMHRTAQHLPLFAPTLDASDQVLPKVLESIKSIKREKQPIPISSTSDSKKSGSEASAPSTQTPSWLRAAAVLLMVSTLILAYLATNLNQEVDTLETVVENQRLELMNLQQRVEVAERYLDVISGRNSYFVGMDGLDPSPGGFGRIFFNPETQAALLQINGLPVNPSDKDYQLWVIRDGVPISAGIFSVADPDSSQYFELPRFVDSDLAQVDAVAVTLEPEGGMPQPTGDMFLLGTPSS
ncbi:MAG: anti-sigma factor [Balneolales bacterium]|nr:anti-sigma factor [Balneolales bacterium]